LAALEAKTSQIDCGMSISLTCGIEKPSGANETHSPSKHHT
jgi:hypothetical protein